MVIALAAILETLFLLALKQIVSPIPILPILSQWNPFELIFLGVLVIFLRTLLLIWGHKYTTKYIQAWVYSKQNNLDSLISKNHFPLYRPKFQEQWIQMHREGIPVIKQGLLAKINSIFSLLQLLFLLPVALLFSWKLSIILLILFIPILILVQFRTKILRTISSRWYKAQSSMQTTLQRYTTFLEYFLGNSHKNQEWIDQEWNSYRHQELKWEISNRSFAPIMEFLYLLIIALLFILIINTTSVNEQLFPFIILILMLYKPILEWSKHIPEYQLSQKAWKQWVLFKKEVENFPQENIHFSISENTLSSKNISVEDITFRYNIKSYHSILKNISFTLSLNDYTLIYGKNGSGKTTLVRIFAQIERPQSGKIHLPKNWREYYTYLPQNPSIPNTFSEEIIKSKETNNKYFLQLTEILDLSHLFRSMPIKYNWEWFSKLSGGEKQRCCLFYTFIQNTPFLILDEPTAWIPSNVRFLMLKKLKELWKEKWNNNGGWMLVSHESHAPKICTRIINLKNSNT